MKSKDIQKFVLSKHESGHDTVTKIFRDLNGIINYDTVRRWCKMIDKTGVIQLSSPQRPLRFVHTKQMILFDVLLSPSYLILASVDRI